MPCPATRKKPMSVQAASICRATSRRAASLPLRSGETSIVGIVLSRPWRNSIDAVAKAIQLYLHCECGNGAERQPWTLHGVIINRRSAIASMLASAGAGAPRIVRAQSGFPERPIRIIVPVSPGGGVDTFARLIAAKIGEQRNARVRRREPHRRQRHSRRPRCASRHAGRLYRAVPCLDA